MDCTKGNNTDQRKLAMDRNQKQVATDSHQRKRAISTHQGHLSTMLMEWTTCLNQKAMSNGTKQPCSFTTNMPWQELLSYTILQMLHMDEVLEDFKQ